LVLISIFSLLKKRCEITNKGVDEIMKNYWNFPIKLEIEISKNYISKEKLEEFFEFMNNTKILKNKPKTIPQNEPELIKLSKIDSKNQIIVLKLFKIYLELPIHLENLLNLDGRFLSNAFKSVKIKDFIFESKFFETKFINYFLQIHNVFAENNITKILTKYKNIMKIWENNESTEILLSNNEISWENIGSLCDFCFNTKIIQIERLDISGNPLGTKGIRIFVNEIIKIPNIKLRNLNLENCFISSDEDSVESIKLILTTLRYFLYKVILRYRLLESLNLSHNKINDTALDNIKDNIIWSEKLHFLDFSYNELTEKSDINLKYISQNKKNLDSLILVGNSCLFNL